MSYHIKAVRKIVLWLSGLSPPADHRQGVPVTQGSICVCGQGHIGTHFRFSEMRVFATIASFRMTAVIATLNGFPFSLSLL